MGRYLEASKTMGIFIQDGRTKIGFFSFTGRTRCLGRLACIAFMDDLMKGMNGDA
jgi:hypothetical protein